MDAWHGIDARQVFVKQTGEAWTLGLWSGVGLGPLRGSLPPPWTPLGPPPMPSPCGMSPGPTIHCLPLAPIPAAKPLLVRKFFPMSASISRNNVSLLSQSQAAQRQTDLLPECLSLLPQGKDCTRDQNREVTGGGGGLEMGLTKVKHMSPRKQNVVVVSGAWRLGPASDQNLKSFPGGEALATKRSELSPAGCPVWGIRNRGMPTGQSPSGSLQKLSLPRLG